MPARRISPHDSAPVQRSSSIGRSSIPTLSPAAPTIAVTGLGPAKARDWAGVTVLGGVDSDA